jgi:GTP-binding protein HflX
MLEAKTTTYETAVLIGIVNQFQDEEKSKEYLDELELLTYTQLQQFRKKPYPLESQA